MDILLVLKALVMGIVEGATEFLPVSSTGHLIIAGQLINFPAKDNVFEIVIQTGAILAVILLYFAKLWSTLVRMPHDLMARRFAFAVAIGFLPAALLGVAFHDFIKEYLFNLYVIAIALIIGGLIILWVERQKITVTVSTVDDIRLSDALKIGLFQCIAMIPGVSRSGATIMGALMLGIERKAAAEFSFFLSIPTLIGAGVYDLLKSRHELGTSDMLLIAIGMLSAFLSALIVVKGFVAWISRNGFTAFAWYRIVLGILILAFLIV